MFIYDLHSRKSSEFHAIQCLYDLHSRESSEFYAVQCLYMTYIRGSPQSFMQYNVIYDLHSRKSSEFHAMQRLYMIYIRGSPQSFMQCNVYIWFTLEEVLRVSCNAMFIYDAYSRKSSEFYAIQCLYMNYIRESSQSFMQCNVYI